MGQIVLTAKLQNGDEIKVIGHRVPGGLCVDQDGTVLGRFLASGVYLDKDTAVTALRNKLGRGKKVAPETEKALVPRPEEPKLCPAPTRDQPGSRNKVFDIAYPEYVDEHIVNPGFPPVPSGLAFAFFNPITGRFVRFDGCQYTTGDPQEYKAAMSYWYANPFIPNGN